MIPHTHRLMIAITAAFGVGVWLVGQLHGIPLATPTERVSLALGTNALAPVVLSMIGYLAVTACRWLATRDRRRLDGIGREMLLDLAILACFVTANYFHFSLKMWVPVLNPGLHDPLYHAVDLALAPLVQVCDHIKRWLNDVLSDHRWYQITLHLNVVGAFCLLKVLRSPLHGAFALTAILVTVFGALSYLAAPALGPFLFGAGTDPLATQAQAGMLEARRLVEAGGAAWIAENGGAYFTGALAAMPSLHVAYATVTLWYVWRTRSPLVVAFAAAWCFTLIAAVATRWHYLVDLPAGMILALACIGVSSRLVDRTASPRRIQPAGPAAPAVAPRRGLA